MKKGLLLQGKIQASWKNKKRDLYFK